jgi:hypothetical protein
LNFYNTIELFLLKVIHDNLTLCLLQGSYPTVEFSWLLSGQPITQRPQVTAFLFILQTVIGLLPQLPEIPHLISSGHLSRYI